MNLRLDRALAVVAIAVALLSPDTGRCEWLPNGNPVGTGPSNQQYSQIVSDGSGGAIISWGLRGGTRTVGLMVQRLDRDGVARWTEGGVLVTPDSVGFSKLTADGFGGVIVVWNPWIGHPGAPRLTVQRIDANGVALWGASGLPVTTNALDYFPVADGTGGVLIVSDNATDSRVVIRHIRYDGSLAWTVEDHASSVQWGYETAVSDGAGGVIYATPDHAQRVDSTGALRWNSPVVRLDTAGIVPDVVTDGQGGAIFAWIDPRRRIIAQRLNADGARLWTPFGVKVYTLFNREEALAIGDDGVGGAILAWNDYRGATPDVYAQHVDAAGSTLWPTNGIPVCFGGSWKEFPVVVSDMKGGAIVAWDDLRDGYCIFAQDIDAGGHWLLDPYGGKVAQGPDPRSVRESDFGRSQCFRVSDGRGGAILTWADRRTGAYDAYAGHVSAPVPIKFDFDPNTVNLNSSGNWVTGYMQPPAPWTAGDIDIGSVRVNSLISASPGAPTAIGDHDGDGTSDLMLKFDRVAVELALDAGGAVPVIVTGRVGSEAFFGVDTIRVPSVITAPAAGTILQPAAVTSVSWEVSEVVVDSVAILCSFDGATWTLVARAQPNTGNYQWTVPDVSCGQARIAVALVAAPDSTGELITEVLGTSGRFSIMDLTVVDSGARPAFALRGAVPNPAWADFHVDFTLPDSKPATVALYDVSGRQVASRSIGGSGAGRHVLVLGGRGLPTGIYLIQLTQNGRAMTRRAAFMH